MFKLWYHGPVQQVYAQIACTLPVPPMPTLIARFMGPTWGPSGTDKTQVGPMLAHVLCYLGKLAVLGHDLHWLGCQLIVAQWSLSTLVRVMACCVIGAKALPRTVITNRTTSNKRWWICFKIYNLNKMCSKAPTLGRGQRSTNTLTQRDCSIEQVLWLAWLSSAVRSVPWKPYPDVPN